MKPEIEAAVIAFYDAFYGPVAGLDGGWHRESDVRKDHFGKCMAEALQAIPLSRDLLAAMVDPIGPRDTFIAAVNYLTEAT